MGRRARAAFRPVPLLLRGPGGRRRRAEGDAGRGRRVGRGGRRARALGRRRRRAPAAPRPGPAGAADRARAAGRRHLGAPRGRGDGDRGRRRRRACGGRRRSRSAGSAITCRAGSTRRSAPIRKGASLIPLARELYASLEVGRATLVHGDFHHHNILRAGDRYLAIDTKAMLGEPEYDIAVVPPESARVDDDRSTSPSGGSPPSPAGPRSGADARVGRDPRRLPRLGRARGRVLRALVAELQWRRPVVAIQRRRLRRRRSEDRSTSGSLEPRLRCCRSIASFYGGLLGFRP